MTDFLGDEAFRRVGWCRGPGPHRSLFRILLVDSGLSAPKFWAILRWNLADSTSAVTAKRGQALKQLTRPRGLPNYAEVT
jgi:hypothetical protein